MRILIILSLFLAPFLSYSATTISAASVYGADGRSWSAGPHNSSANGWPCGQSAGNVFCYTASTSELNEWCLSYPSGGPPFGNPPSCSRIKNGGVRQGYPLIVEFESGSIYDKTSSCEIKITFNNLTRSFYGNGSLAGFIQSSSATYTGGSWKYLASFSAVFNNCRQAMMDLGIKHGYGSNWDYKTELYTANPAIINMCIYVDNQSIGCSYSYGTVTPPAPAVCNISVPLNLDYGVVNSKEVDGTQQDISIDYQCNKAATVSFSLLGGTPNNSGVTLNMGSGLTSELCFMSGASCPSTGGANIKSTGTTGSVKLQSTLRGTNVSGGDYSSSVTVVSAFY
ncbi:hypothetical protein [Providencia sneebia]|uniref:Fimbrial adhesin MrpH C-terminal domain-containing protein n=1 Tax=Providencia sneebia DSM 19967 TaxID=1141660 RepID=K8WM40_9GAMM|nr:hypothetical protein [Providencia sneebia]EKT58542.1 hypothetical protein OO7_07499 [Providencia sneebia DSM 19967]